jgi:F0F1-type ATP synthase delta subunit
VDIEAIEDLLQRIAQLADEHPQLASVTLSPCIAAQASLTILGARIVIAPTADQRDPLARGL